MISLEADTTRASQVIYRLKEVLQVDGAEVLRDETRRLARTIVRFIPPLGAGAKETGEHALERDVKSLFSEASPKLIDEVGSQFGVQNVTGAYRTELGGVDLNLRWDNIDYAGSKMEDFHKRYRTPEGRIPKPTKSPPAVWSARVVVPSGSRQPFIDKLKGRVGMWKATWAYIGYVLGDKPYAHWITRLFSAVASNGLAIADISQASDKVNPVIVFGSRAPGNYRMAPGIQTAIDVRVRAMKARLKLILNGYKKDVEAHQLPEAKAKAQLISEPLEEA